MPEQVLKFLTYVFLALLYLFFLRVLRAVWSELREPKAAVPAPVVVSAGGSEVDQFRAAPEAGSKGGRRSRRNSSKKTKVERIRIVEPEARRGQEFDLGPELTFGRAPTNGVALPEDTFVSQLHARLFRRDQDVWIEDLGSTNGTFLNDKKVSTPVVMRQGDRLKVGKTVVEMVR